jgi:PBSX family phage terminase large subunit
MEYGVTEVFIKHDFFSSLKIKLVEKVNDKLFLYKDNGDNCVKIKQIVTSKKLYEIKKGFFLYPLEVNFFYFYEEGEHSIFRYKYIKHVGSSRSSKSWSIEEYIIRKCEENKNLRVTVWRDTRESLGNSVWKDFKKIFPLSGRKYKFTRNTVPIFFNNSSIIEPHGDDTTNAHGITQDIAWLNEPYKMTNETFDQIDQRAEQIIIDINPSGMHWSDNLDDHPRCKVIHSTFKNNPFCPVGQKLKILSYDPANPINVSNGTADAYMHSVYALGEKAEKPNRIYRGFIIISDAEFDNIPASSYFGLDFGSTNPSALVEVKFYEDCFFSKERLYMPISQMTLSLAETLEFIGIEKNSLIIADSADPNRISELLQYGFNVVPAIKGPGSVNQGIDFVNSKQNYFTSSSNNYQFEYENYEWEIVKGMNLDRPIKKDDHIIDADRYVKTFLQFYLGIK